MSVSSIKVLIVDDSFPMRVAMQQAISRQDSGIQVVKTVGSAEEVKKVIHELLPDVVIVNDSLPDINVKDFIGKLHSVLPVPVIVIGSNSEGLSEAMKAGAADTAKIGSLGKKDFSAFCSEICVKVKIAAQPAPRQLNLPSLFKIGGGGGTRYNIIAIGASTGGTEATAQVLKGLPPDIPGIVIVQHMPAGFTKMYAERLDKITMLKVSEAKDGDRVTRGAVLVAEGGKHMRVKKDGKGYYVKCVTGERVNGHCPSVGVLFDSVADAAGADAIGVILTGMGHDGAKELLKMKKAGAYTIGQDKESSVVYGMPMVAKEMGAVDRQAPCDAISNIILSKLK